MPKQIKIKPAPKAEEPKTRKKRDGNGRPRSWVQDPKNGRPPGLPYKPEQIEAFLNRLSETANITRACNDTGVDRGWVYSYKARYPEFAKEVYKRLDIGVDALEDKAKDRAFHGNEVRRYNKDGDVVEEKLEFSDTLAVLLLRGHRPERYRERSEVTNNNGGPGGRFNTMSDAELDELIKRTEQAGSK